MKQSSSHSLADSNISLQNSNSAKKYPAGFKKVSLMSVMNNKDSGTTSQLGEEPAGAIQYFPPIQEKLLPCFSGICYYGSIERVNSMVVEWMNRGSFTTINQEMVTFIKTGMVTVSSKLNSVSNDAFPHKLADVWSSYYSNTIPLLLAAFLPLKNYVAMQGKFGKLSFIRFEKVFAAGI
jgi:hypothetical protein